MIKRIILILICSAILAGLALAADPVQPFLPFYWIKGRVTSAETGDPVPGRTVAFYKNNFATEPRATATSDAGGYYKVNVYDLNYFYGTPITFETESYKVAVPRTFALTNGTEETTTLTVEVGYTLKNLVVIEGGGPIDRTLGAGPIINLTVLLEGLNRGTPTNNVPASLEVELRAGGATADTAVPANIVATCEVQLGTEGSGSNYGWWYNDIYPTAGQKYYLVLKQKIPGAPVGVNHLPIITASSWEIVSQPGSLAVDLSTSESTSFAEAYTPAGRTSAMVRIGNRLLMRAGYLDLSSTKTKIDIFDNNIWLRAALRSASVIPSDPESITADINEDGVVDIFDNNLWLRTALAFGGEVDLDHIYVPMGP